jgi:hypothetical protein
MTLGLVALTVLAAVALPFVFGYWIGQAVLAAAPFAALGITVFIRQVEIGEIQGTGGRLLAGILISTLLSVASAYFGGRLRERQREPL